MTEYYKGVIHWRCEHPDTQDVKMAAKPDHKAKLEADGYVCEVYSDEAAPEIEEGNEQ